MYGRVTVLSIFDYARRYRCSIIERGQNRFFIRASVNKLSEKSDKKQF